MGGREVAGCQFCFYLSQPAGRCFEDIQQPPGSLSAAQLNQATCL
jgi:hypothetical protein